MSTEVLSNMLSSIAHFPPGLLIGTALVLILSAVLAFNQLLVFRRILAKYFPYTFKPALNKRQMAIQNLAGKKVGFGARIILIAQPLVTLTLAVIPIFSLFIWSWHNYTLDVFTVGDRVSLFAVGTFMFDNFLKTALLDFPEVYQLTVSPLVHNASNLLSTTIIMWFRLLVALTIVDSIVKNWKLSQPPQRALI